MRWRLLAPSVAALLVAVLGGATLPLPAAAAAVAPEPVLEPAPCPVEVPEGSRVECGYVQVPESREDPDGRQVRLLVAVLRSAAEQPEPDPLVVTSGGPGSSSAGLLSLARSVYARDRDVVVVEQRGARWSQPWLACPEVEAALLGGLRTADSTAAETDREVAAARVCASRLREEGNDLSAYTTADLAEDLVDVRAALGYDRWNLYGLSYSTRLALTVLRDHPDGLRAVLLDSVSPPELAQYDVRVTALQDAFSRLAEDCAAQRACEAAYPDLQASLVEAAQRLDADPLPVDAVSPDTGEPVRLLLTGDDLVSVVFNALYDPALARLVPLVVDRLGARDADAAAPLADAALRQLSRYSLGSYYSVQCAEQAPLTDRQAAERDADAFAGIPDVHLVWLGSDLDVCEAWDVPPDPAAATPAVGDVPVLVVGGRHDPVTPPAWGREAASRLSRATVVEVPAAGHIPSLQGDCVPGIAAAFLADPEGSVDTSCVDELPPLDFVLPSDVTLTAGVYRLSREAGRGALIALGVGLAAVVVGLLALAWSVRRQRRAGRLVAPAALAGAAGLLQLAAAAGLVWLVLRTAATDQLLLGFGLPAPLGRVLLAVPLVAGLAAAGALVAVAAAARAAVLPAARGPVLLTSGAVLSVLAVATATGLVL